MAVTGTCQACLIPNVRVAPATTDCACLVCERCAQMFLDEGLCGVCGTPLPADEGELLQDEEV
jgi:hypothetical protein